MWIIKSSQLRPLLCGFITNTTFINKLYKYIFVFVSFYRGDIFLGVHTGQPIWNSLWIWPCFIFLKKASWFGTYLMSVGYLCTAWKESKWGVFSGPYLETFHTVVGFGIHCGCPWRLSFFFALGFFHNIIKSIESVYWWCKKENFCRK